MLLHFLRTAPGAERHRAMTLRPSPGARTEPRDRLAARGDDGGRLDRLRPGASRGILGNGGRHLARFPWFREATTAGASCATCYTTLSTARSKSRDMPCPPIGGRPGGALASSCVCRWIFRRGSRRKRLDTCGASREPPLPAAPGTVLVPVEARPRRTGRPASRCRSSATREPAARPRMVRAFSAGSFRPRRDLAARCRRLDRPARRSA